MTLTSPTPYGCTPCPGASVRWKSATSRFAGAGPDFVRAAVGPMVLDTEMTEAIGAAKGERSDTRLSSRGGNYPRSLITYVGIVELQAPQDPLAGSRPSGSVLPAIGEGISRDAGRDVHAIGLDIKGVTAALCGYGFRSRRSALSTNRSVRVEKPCRAFDLASVIPKSCLRLVRALGVEMHQNSPKAVLPFYLIQPLLLSPPAPYSYRAIAERSCALRILTLL